MAGSVNKCIILGTLGKDPESRSFSNGGGVVNLSVATSESWKDKQSGERKEVTEWHRVSIFNDVLGEIVSKYAKKGDKIYIEGQVQTRKWVDQSGVEKYSTEIVVKGFQGVVNLIGRTERHDQQSGNARQSSKREPDNDYGPRGVSSDLDDEIPF
jgi:single-strand DNA-binding protein